MGWWLASERRGQAEGVISRFDPAYWTVNFPRPMMAAVTTVAPDALRVDAVFYRRDQLAGLIWEAEDRWDHPLLAYETSRDFRRTQLRFRWRSGGIKPLDALHAQAHAAIRSSSALAALGKGLRLIETEEPEVEGGDPDVARMRTTYQIFVLTRTADLSRAQ